jgi:hypothetical protein
MTKDKLLMAAVAGIALGATAPLPAVAEEAKDEVKCYGVNGCAAHAKCAVAAEDLAAIKALLGPKDYKERFGKSEAHSCGAHASCGTPQNILNWVPTSADQCKTDGGFVVVQENGKKVAKKA